MGDEVIKIESVHDTNALVFDQLIDDSLYTITYSVSNCAGRREVHCANDLLYDSVFYSVYSNIPVKYTHLRIEPYTRVRILKYNRSRDIHGRLASH